MSGGALEPLSKYKAKVILAPIFKLFECVCELFVPLLVKRIIDYLEATPRAEYEWTTVLWPSLLMLLLAIAGFGLTMVTQYFAAKVATAYSYDLKKNVYHQMYSLSDEQIDKFGKNKVLTIVNNDTFSLQTGVNMFMRLLVRSPFLLIGSVVTSFLLSPLAGVIVLSVLLLSALVVFMVLLLTPKRYQALQKELDHISSLGDDALSGARPIRAFNREEYEIEKFKGVSASYRKKAFSLASINAWLNPLTYVFVNLGVILVLFLSGYHFDISGIGAGTAVAILNYLAQALTALVMFSRLVVSLSKAAASKKRVDEFLSVTPSISSGKEVGRVFEKGETIFELKGASLSYGGEEAALSKIDFILREGESVGIIGGTGSSKSSLISLLERFFDASEGEVLYLGKNIKDYRLDAYRSKIALVSQKPQLFKGTVRSNLLVANPNASEEDIEKALKDSLAAEFVNRYKDGLDHEVEEGGSNLSGGQKQRLLIARALLAGREILILDDSTSALDYKSDSLLRKNVKKRKLTLILVSQRATSVKDMDRIYVLDQGKVVAVGKHEELLSSCSIYQEIYQTQVAVK